MLDSYRKHVARLIVRLGLLDEGRLAPYLADDGASLCRRLVDEGLIDEAAVERLYATLREALLRADGRALERRAEGGLVRLAVDHGLVDRATVVALDAARQERPLAERPTLPEMLLGAGKLSPEQRQWLEERLAERHRACTVCGELGGCDGAAAHCPRCGWSHRRGSPDRDTAHPGAVDDARELVDGFLGRQLGRCRLLRKLGQGGMGAVYVAHHTGLDREVAVKILPHSLAMEGEYRERFLREARTAARLDHPGVVRVWDVACDQDTWYMVQELVDGESLQAKLQREGPLPPREAVRLACEVARALGAAHRAGLIHRDVKPDNLLLTRDGQVKLVDFGLARALEDSSISRTGQMVGTPAFMPPEQANGLRVDERADVYSLGITLYALLAGRSPFERGHLLATLMAVADDELPPLPPGCAPGLDAVLARLCAKSAEQRYRSMDEVLSALEGWLAGPAPASGRRLPGRAEAKPRPTSSRVEARSVRRGRAPSPLPIVAVGLAALAGVLGWAMWPGESPSPTPPPDPVAPVAKPPSDPAPHVARLVQLIGDHLHAERFEPAQAALAAFVARPPVPIEAAALSELARAQRERIAAKALDAFRRASTAILVAGPLDARLQLEGLPSWGLRELDEERDRLLTALDERLAALRRAEAEVAERRLREEWAGQLAELFRRLARDPAGAAEGFAALAGEARFAALAQERGDERHLALRAALAIERGWRARLFARPQPLLTVPRWTAQAVRFDGQSVELVLQLGHAEPPQEVRRSVPLAAFDAAQRASWAGPALPSAEREALVAAYCLAAGVARAPELIAPRGFTLRGPNAWGFTVAVREADGLEIVWIPRSEPWSRGPDHREGRAAAHPDVPADSLDDEAEPGPGGFWIGVREVTMSQFARFVEEHPEWRPGGRLAREQGEAYLVDWNGAAPPAGRAAHPVVWVTARAAQAYCEASGMRLPSASQRARAAAGPCGLRYPWGDEFDPPGRAATASAVAGELVPTVAAWHARFYRPWRRGERSAGPRPVASTPGDVSPFGCHDLAGNVREWVSIDANQNGVAGGGWDSGDWEARCRALVRAGALDAHGSLGFRVALEGRDGD